MSYPYPKAVSLSVDAIGEVERLIARNTETTGNLGAAARYLLERPGKQVRVRLCLDLAHSLRLPPQDGVILAAAVEMLHSASLVLDDVQDSDDMRRDRPTVWRKFGKIQAINLGAYLIAQSFTLAARLPGASPYFALALSDATTGQSAEMDFQAEIPTLAAYNAMAEKKTGALFSLPAQAAAVLAKLPDHTVSQIGLAFAQLGIAYQLQDDLADALGLKGRARAGLDLREGKANGIVVLHLALKPADLAEFLAFQQDCLARNDDEQLDEWLERLFASGSVAVAQDYLRNLCDDLVTISTTISKPFSAHLSELAMGIANPAVLQRTNEVLISHYAS